MLWPNPERRISVWEIGEKVFRLKILANVIPTLGRVGVVQSIRSVSGVCSLSGNTTFFGSTTPVVAVPMSDSTAAEWFLGRILFELEDTANARLGAIIIATKLTRITRHRAALDLKAAVG